jgi:GNAT superfamily N-acetyltransferase
MTIRRMTLNELKMVLGWAEAEGWNPGLEDADAFYASDPKGFFVKDIDGEPVASVSVVSHDEDFAFLGLYICRPEYRGRGYGTEVWQTGMAHAGTRSVGLDAVPEQQENYAVAGFSKVSRTHRYAGGLSSARADQTRLATHADVEALVDADSRATGIGRLRFSRHWFRNTPTRRTLIVPSDRSQPVFATFRQCRNGVKVGPFHANTRDQAERLLCGLPADWGDGPVFLDVPEGASDLIDLLTDWNFEPVFQTARMFHDGSPDNDPPAYYALGTLELG